MNKFEYYLLSTHRGCNAYKKTKLYLLGCSKKFVFDLQQSW